jgi:tetratricopeptide (TPR) repeat protein
MRRIIERSPQPEPSWLIQLGLLYLAKGDLPDAEGVFARAFAADPGSFAAAHNLLMTRLSLGQLDNVEALIAETARLAPDQKTNRLFEHLGALLRSNRGPESGGGFDKSLGAMEDAEEERLLEFLCSLGRLDLANALLETLTAIRPKSAAAERAQMEGTVLAARLLFECCQWRDALALLRPVTQTKSLELGLLAAVHNLCGCCLALDGNWDQAIPCYEAALALLPGDSRVAQNLAIAHEHALVSERAESFWDRYLGSLVAGSSSAQHRSEYVEQFQYACLNRLADRCIEKKYWTDALGYAQRAHQERPKSVEPLEKLFHIYRRVDRTEDARWALDQLLKLKPDEIEYRFYEVDLLHVHDLAGAERLLREIHRVLGRSKTDSPIRAHAAERIETTIAFFGA